MKSQLIITGMHCASCVKNIENSLDKTLGVSGAVVNLASEKAIVEYDPEKISLEGVIKAVEKAGYGAEEYVLKAPDTNQKKTADIPWRLILAVALARHERISSR